MVQCADGGSVSIVVEGQALQEYGVERKKEGNVETHLCCEFTESRQWDFWLTTSIFE